MQKIPPRLRAFAKEQRRSMTRAEAVLWRELRPGRFAGCNFRRQVPIGPYIADFVCFAARLFLELDGEPHDKPEQIEHDGTRDAWLKSQDFRVLRFKNEIVLGNANLVLSPIAEALRLPRDPA
ncbi:MAG: endonuclease domain-containing protein [Microvirga sp.]